VIDIVDQQTRSRMMSGIRGKNTKPELALRRALHARGFRFRLHSGKVHGRPDLVLPKHRAVVFVHGCFWHLHGCPRSLRQPKANADYWSKKLARNAERDAANIVELRRLGWRPLVIWECGLKDEPALIETLKAELGPPGPINPSSGRR
jgi:DNA mismatch endonuclease (patch repair protein)